LETFYGVIGAGDAPTSVIHESLRDIGTDVTYYIPWYGTPTHGLISVYDWVLDNSAAFFLVVDSSADKPAPRALRTMAERIIDSVAVTNTIVKELRKHDGIALVLWDSDNEAASIAVSTAAIEGGLPTLELTNGMVPILFDDQPVQDNAVTSSDDLTVETIDGEAHLVLDADDEEEDTEFDRATLENMPAALVKRMAKDHGAPAKTKAEAIDAILGGVPDETPSLAKPVSIHIVLDTNNTITLGLSKDLLEKVFNLVVAETQNW
jgi:hypothetical protein